MKNEITIFENSEFGKIRVIEINGEPWFVGIDVANTLGYQNGSRDINRHIDADDRNKTMIFVCLGNAIKCILRAGKKDPEKKAEDLNKAIWYIKRANKSKDGKVHSKYIKCMSCGDYFPPENDDDLICENCKEKYVDEKEIEDSILFYPWLSEDQIKNINNKGSEINE